jgi:hypothetical protein
VQLLVDAHINSIYANHDNFLLDGKYIEAMQSIEFVALMKKGRDVFLSENLNRCKDLSLLDAMEADAVKVDESLVELLFEESGIRGLEDEVIIVSEANELVLR